MNTESSNFTSVPEEFTKQVFYIIFDFRLVTWEFFTHTNLLTGPFFVYLGFLSGTFKNQGAVGEGGDHFLNFSLRLPLASQTFRQIITNY